jgi:hypothetical protein
MLIDDPRPIICPVCSQRTAIKDQRIVPHLSGMTRFYCTGTGLMVKPYELGEFEPRSKWNDPDDEEPTQDP